MQQTSLYQIFPINIIPIFAILLIILKQYPIHKFILIQQQPMVSPTKQKYKQRVKQQILTNYYLSKYDKYVPHHNNRNNQNIPQRQNNNYKSNNPNRKNFKQLILQRKANLNKQKNKQVSGRKNFKEEIQNKNSRGKVQRMNKKVFSHLEDTIVNQLYRPSPSQLQNGKFQQIQILHKISYQDRQEKIQPFQLQHIEKQDHQNIQILGNDQQNQGHEVSFERLQHQKIVQSIKATFQKRSPTHHKSKAKSPTNKDSKSLSKSPQNKFPPRYQSNNNSHQQSDIFQHVRPNFQYIDRKMNNNQISSESFDDLSSNQKIMKQNISISISQQKRNPVTKGLAQKSLQKQQLKNRNTSRRNSIAQSVKKNSSFNDDSFHRNIPDIQHQPKLIPEKQKSQPKYQQYNSQNKSSHAHNQSIQKESMHDFSMMSRFSMATEQGQHIKQQLQKQLNENQYGPYQNSLTSLLHLLDVYPNAWPIFVVGQRILQDRHQYQNKRKIQQNQMSRLQANIQGLNRIKNKRTKIQQNSITILNLIRKLSKTLEQDN